MPFTDTEESIAIDSFPVGKSPGPNGHTSLFYSRFKEPLTPIMTGVFNLVSTATPFTAKTQEAHITIFPEANKDPSQCAIDQFF